MGAPKNLGVHPFPDSVSHFGIPLWLLRIFKVLIEGMTELKNFFSKSCSFGGIDLFSDPVGHYGLSKQCSIAGGE